MPRYTPAQKPDRVASLIDGPRVVDRSLEERELRKALDRIAYRTSSLASAITIAREALHSDEPR
jgi:hypothetical protein